MKKIIMGLGTIAATVAPIAAVISCGNSAIAKKQRGELDNVFIASNNAGSSNSSGTIQGAIEGTKAADADTIPKWYGKSRPDDHLKGTNEGIEITSRITGGHPKSPGINISDLWNWTPEYAEDGDASHFYGVGKRLDYVDANGQPTYTRGRSTLDPVINFLGQRPDYGFNRATIRNVQPRMFGGELKPSQSTFAKVTNMEGFVPKNGDTDLGFTPGISNDQQHPMSSPQYTDIDIPWNPGPHFDAKWESGERIDFMHRNGVPVLGTILMYPRPSTGEGERNIQVLCNPGPNHDFPVAKGLVELAHYYGFDGWFIDWELSNNIEPFLKALNDYSHKGEYEIQDGPKKGQVVKLADEYAATRRKFKYNGNKNLMVTNYWRDEITAKYSDYYYYPQNHGGLADVNHLKENWANAKGNGLLPHQSTAKQFMKDRYFYNNASNAPEDPLSRCRGIIGQYYWAARQANPTDANGQQNAMNQFSWWMWYYSSSSDIAVDEEMWSSYAGDPRVFDGPQSAAEIGDMTNYIWNDKKANDPALIEKINRFSVSNGFREHTSILGNKDWQTSFNYGNGMGFNLWGGQDIAKNVIGTSEKGWTNQKMVDMLPTYRWIVDWYDQNGNKETDLSLDANGKLAHRPITPYINNKTKHAYMGGSTLDFKGSLEANKSFVSKLYASNIPVENNDKFKIKIKNNWKTESDRIIPELALWTSNNKIAWDDFYKSDGSETDPLDANSKLGWADQHDGVHNAMHPLLKYQKDTRKGQNITQTFVQQSNVEDLGNGWLEVTYDLSSQVGKSIMDFGIKATSKGDKTLTKLSLGEMKFDAAADVTPDIAEIKNVKTDKIWNVSTNQFKKARISWETMSANNVDYDPSEIRNYYVFYKNDKGERTGLAWIGATPFAFLDKISKDADHQYVEILAVDYNNDIIYKQDAKVKL